MKEEARELMDWFYVDTDLLDPSTFAWLCPPDEQNIQLIRADLDTGGRIMTPLHAFKKEDGRWELLAGHDRLEAAKRADYGNVPVLDTASPDRRREGVPRRARQCTQEDGEPSRRG